MISKTILLFLNIKLKYSQFWILIYPSIRYLFVVMKIKSAIQILLKNSNCIHECMYIIREKKKKSIFEKTKTFIWCVNITLLSSGLHETHCDTILVIWTDICTKRTDASRWKWWYVLRKSFEFIGIQGINIL